MNLFSYSIGSKCICCGRKTILQTGPVISNSVLAIVKLKVNVIKTFIRAKINYGKNE